MKLIVTILISTVVLSFCLAGGLILLAEILRGF
jgi:hypothetical protein